MLSREKCVAETTRHHHTKDTENYTANLIILREIDMYGELTACPVLILKNSMFWNYIIAFNIIFHRNGLKQNLFITPV